ncbi:MAG TPA: hypothetical protein ENH81_04095, partial [Thermococcus sp.]|nr:hypothetical protein [Thermococcus sp.]
YESSHKNYDLAIPFIERGYSLLRKNGELGFIVTKKWMKADYGEKLREILSRERAVRLIIDFGDEQVFKGATTYTMILVLRKAKNEKFTYAKVEELKESIEQLRAVHEPERWREERISVLEVPEEELSEKPWVFLTEGEREIVKKVYEGNVRLIDLTSSIFQGLATSADKVYHLIYQGEDEKYFIVLSNSTGKAYRIEKDLLKPLASGENVKAFIVVPSDKLLLFPYEPDDDGIYHLIPEDTFKQKYPNAWKYLLENREILENRERGKMKDRSDWYGYIYPKNLEKHVMEKMLVPRLVSDLRIAYDQEGKYYVDNVDVNGIILKDRELYPLVLGLLNSSLLNYIFKQNSVEFASGYYSANKQFIKDLPIKLPQTDEEKALAEEIEVTVEEILDLLKKHYLVKSLWEEWSEKLGNKKLTLRKLIEKWEKGVGRLPQEKLFFTNVRIISDEETEYDGFEPELKDGTLRLLGRVGDILTPVLELEGKEELLEHVYLSILSLLESRRKSKTLGDILSKTTVPTIDGSPAETERITAIVKEKANAKHLTSFLGLVRENEAYLDALVFRLYGLSAEDARIVLESLGKSQDYIDSVIEHL